MPHTPIAIIKRLKTALDLAIKELETDIAVFRNEAFNPNPAIAARFQAFADQTQAKLDLIRRIINKRQK